MRNPDGKTERVPGGNDDNRPPNMMILTQVCKYIGRTRRYVGR